MFFGEVCLRGNLVQFTMVSKGESALEEATRVLSR